MINKIESQTLTKNRNKILKAALDVFLRDGIANATIAQIAEKAKVTKRTIFNYYSSKDLLAEDLQIRTIQKLSQHQAVDFSLDVNELAKIRNFLDSFIQTNPNAIKMIKYVAAFDNYYVNGYPTENYGKEVAKIVEPFYQLVAIFEEGQKRGIIKKFPFVDAMTMYLSIFQLFNAYIQRFYYRQEAIKEEGFTDAMGNPKFVIDLIILGLATSADHIPQR
jgi:AcrR family transcriptional regulator